jgi:hypothetical protein
MFVCYTGIPHDSFVARLAENGNSWDDIFPIYEFPRYLRISPAGDLFSIGFGAIVITTDKGNTWSTWHDTLLTMVSALRFSPTGSIFVGARNSYRSTDGGKHWELMPLQPSVMDMLPMRNDIVLAGIFTGIWPNPTQHIYRSADNGGTWLKVLDAGTTYGWSFAETKNGTVFAAPEGTDSSGNGIYRSTDSGASWSRANNGLPSTNVCALAASSNGNLYAAITGFGVFQSVDNGETWTDFNTGLTNLQVHCLAVDSTDNLYAGTDWMGSSPYVNVGEIFKYNMPTTAVEKISPISESLILYQNYPNPFNPVTTIGYSLPKRGRAIVTVHNFLGQNIRHLVDREQEAGYHEVRFDGSGLSSGIYFCRVASNQSVQTKKLLLLR